MKYARLTKEQFEELHQEFINFLATQSITAAEWEDLKKQQPEIVEQELDIFSDLIWEGVLGKVSYLDHIAPHSMQLFFFDKEQIHLIAVKVDESVTNFMTYEGLRWLEEHIMDETVSLYTASKSYSDDRFTDIFLFIKQGAVISDGTLYRSLQQFMKTS
ncbi:DUF6495 family protein [Ascidiimonas aurantiaca]|uniref:DUF6495 family protein n=1 Tax=Ascidiimonas aurantiaca TaxID=1685432 RepID=UPI0030EC6F6E